MAYCDNCVGVDDDAVIHRLCEECIDRDREREGEEKGRARRRGDHLSSENASLARQVESMAMRIESLAEELAKPEDVRLREVLDVLDGRAVIFDGLGARVGHLLDEMDEWIGRAGEAERLAEERLAHANQLQADIEAEMQGRLALRKRLGAREDETMGAFLERLAAMAGVVPLMSMSTDGSGDLRPQTRRSRRRLGRFGSAEAADAWWQVAQRRACAARKRGPDGRGSAQPRLAARVQGCGRAHAGGLVPCRSPGSQG